MKQKTLKAHLKQIDNTYSGPNRAVSELRLAVNYLGVEQSPSAKWLKCYRIAQYEYRVLRGFSVPGWDAARLEKLLRRYIEEADKTTKKYKANGWAIHEDAKMHFDWTRAKVLKINERKAEANHANH